MINELLKPTEMYAFILNEVNELLIKYNLRLSHINMRSGEYSVPFGDRISKQLEIQHNNRVMCVRDYFDNKIVFVFELLDEQYNISLSRNFTYISNMIMVIIDYILGRYSSSFKKMDQYFVDLSSLKPRINESNCLDANSICDLFNHLHDDDLAILPKQQSQVAWLTYLGHSIQQIANEMDISEPTVICYLNIIKKKLKTHSKKGIINWIRKRPFILGDEYAQQFNGFIAS
ncbi:MAG: hypothetical protein EP298_05550 [Gammaproteobacteria bacterium]|nr:MAG: hypothetical protein EP298_05550 [Gammaproteobacteria bacterium]UTW42739.1 sigma-70 region 4 domain-containing protein [bacterium SCSIO 12844]